MDSVQVYARFDDTLWVGVNWLATQGPLTRDLEYVTLPVSRRGEYCLTMPDGRILCDFGPRHAHNVEHRHEVHPDSPGPDTRHDHEIRITAAGDPDA